MFARKPVTAPPPAQVYTPLPPGVVRDPKAVEDETPAPDVSDDERYWGAP